MSSRRIYLRGDRDSGRTIEFSSNAQVLDRGREYPISWLQRGDIVAMQIRKNADGVPFADLIRIQKKAGNRSTGGRVDPLAESPPRILTLSGTVERVDPGNHSFDLNDQPGKPLLVVMSPSARDSDRERLRTLQAGDHVRIEGQFIGQERFEMLGFLSAES